MKIWQRDRSGRLLGPLDNRHLNLFQDGEEGLLVAVHSDSFVKREPSAGCGGI